MMSNFVGYIDNEGRTFDGNFQYDGAVGPKGDPGYTPQKGIDYFTPEEIAEIQQPLVPKTTTIAGVDLQDNVTKDELRNALEIPTKTSDLTNDSDYQNSTEVEAAINSKMSTVYKYKGSVAYYENLPTSDQQIGDVWNIENAGSGYDAGDNVAWTGTGWDKLAGTIDLSGYYTQQQTDALLDEKQDLIDVSNLLSADLVSDDTTANVFIKKLTGNPIKIYELETGIYSIPESKKIIYNGDTQEYFTTNYNYNVYLFVRKINDTVRYWNLTGVTSTVDQPLVYYGNSSPTGGAYTWKLLESINNKVTSISSSSTDEQYPTAKLLYDQLALKQGTLTAGDNIDLTSDIISTIGDTIKTISTEVTICSLDTGVYKVTSSAKLIVDDSIDPSYIVTDYEGILIVYVDGSTNRSFVLYTEAGLMYCGQTYKTSSTTVGGTYFIRNPYKFENTDNKVTSIDDTSTDTQYPSAKLLYDQLQAKQAEIDQLYDQIPTATATGDNINIQDSSNLPIQEFELLGNATQADTPTPDYPQDIHVVTGDNVVKVVGKNLYNEADITNAQQWTTSNNYYTGTASKLRAYYKDTKPILNYYKPNTQYTFSWKGYLGTATNVRVRFNYTDSTYSEGANIDSTSLMSAYAISTANKTIESILFNYGTDGTLFAKDIQIEIGTNTTYEPYTSQSITLPLGNIELAKIGDYTDKLFKAIEGDSVYDSLDSTTKASLTSGSWYKQGNIGNKVLNGSEASWGSVSTSQTEKSRWVCNIDNLKMTPSTSEIGKIMANYYSAVGFAGGNGTYNNVQGISISNYTPAKIGIYDNTYNTSLEDYTTWLSTHNLTIYYALATPTYTQITDTTLITALEQWRNTPTYKNVTNSWVEPTGSNAQASQWWKYYQDIKTLFDNLNNAILSINT